MDEAINKQREHGTTRTRASLFLASLTLILGIAFGVIYGRQSTMGAAQNTIDAPTSEITVSKDKGLMFRSEDGTPLMKIEKDSWGTHLRLLSSNGEPVVELNNLQGGGGLVVSSKVGGRVYVHAVDEAATITLLGKYNKEAITITSATQDGSGSVSINEGAKGYPAVQIFGSSNRSKGKGSIIIPGDDKPLWQAP